MTTPGTARPTRAPRRFGRTLLSLRWLHNWVGVIIGAVLVLWVVSGLIMLLPVSDIARRGPGSGAPIDWRAVTISPAQATEIATGSANAAIRGLEMKRLRDGMVYVVRTEPRGSVLVDGSSGKIFTITDTLAATIAADGVPGGRTAIGRIERVDHPGKYEDSGPLPAWRVEFTDAARTEAWVHIATGDVRRSAASDRTKRVWGHDAHVFAPLSDGPGGQRSRVGALWIASFIALFAVAAGYWLALPARWRARFR